MMRLFKKQKPLMDEDKQKAWDDLYRQMIDIAHAHFSHYDTHEYGYIQNIYADIDGVIHPLPFKGKPGLYHFDGQVFYQTKKLPPIMLDKDSMRGDWDFDESAAARNEYFQQRYKESRVIAERFLHG